MIINNCFLCTGWSSEPIIEGALVAIEGKTIVDFGKVGKLVSRYDDSEVVDVGGRLVMPGLINAHVRLGRNLAPGMPVGDLRPRSFEEMRDGLWHPYEDALEPTDLYASALVGLLDALKAGVTTVVSYDSGSSRIEESLQMLRRAFAETGVRGAISYGVTKRRGSPELFEGIRANVEFLQDCRRRKSEMIGGLLGVEAPAGLDDSSLFRVVEAADETESPMHFDVAQTRQELDYCLSRYDRTPVARLGDAGAFLRGGVAAHATHVLPEDDQRLKADGLFIAHCAQSNALNGAGSADLARMYSAGVPVALGTGSAGVSVLEELRAVAWRQRSKGRDMADAIRVAHRAALTTNPELATRLFGPQLGILKPGARADLVVFDYRPSTPVDMANLPEHLFWGISRASVQTTVVNGRVLYHNGKFAGLDEERIRARAREAARQLWERM